MTSDRRLTDRDISVVAGELGVSWRVLGQRLNFTPETLDAIAKSTSGITEDSTHKQVQYVQMHECSRMVKQHSLCADDPHREASML